MEIQELRPTNLLVFNLFKMEKKHWFLSNGNVLEEGFCFESHVKPKTRYFNKLHKVDPFHIVTPREPTCHS